MTELWMLTEFNIVKHSKAMSPILVTELGIIVFIQPATKVFVPVSIIALHLSRESNLGLFSATVIILQSQKALSPIMMTELGMLTDVSPLQPLKAL